MVHAFIIAVGAAAAADADALLWKPPACASRLRFRIQMSVGSTLPVYKCVFSIVKKPGVFYFSAPFVSQASLLLLSLVITQSSLLCSLAFTAFSTPCVLLPSSLLSGSARGPTFEELPHFGLWRGHQLFPCVSADRPSVRTTAGKKMAESNASQRHNSLYQWHKNGNREKAGIGSCHQTKLYLCRDYKNLQ